MAVASLICPETISRVSSVLNREVKQFGKKYMFDRNEETSWNSDQGAIQWLTMEFPQTVQASQIQIQFQGGFASQKLILQGGRKGAALSTVAEFYPEDNNSLQSFPFKAEPLDKLKITFQNSSDFFGRIIVYHLDILGQKL
ncbi:nuclear receptor 2C2-associated protein [Pseudonaja textilis]|uniref:nuclear receptor 2C2-associated protein n=1 Tax=Pseudonaja textilis TaxID=8673 RepID=UPI000EA98150|nr:nuclear receptor 2C2-associated protein [Pseudonaja textilis]XP_026554192.1 nuclear receptor 2C2-associated protein [Pseudonaja textilis]